MSAEETLSCLTRTPAYNQGERNLEAKYRIHCLSRLLHDYYQPLAQHLDIENRISVCLRQGYRNRNPLERQYALMVNESYEAMLEKRDVRPVPGYHPNASGFTIIGVSGVGKRTAVESIRSERETFDVEDIRRMERERMALVQPMLKALRDDNKKEIDRYEDITEILVGEVTSEIRDGQPSAVKQPAARAFERVRDKVLEYFVKMRKQPEKVEEFIAQAYRQLNFTMNQ